MLALPGDRPDVSVLDELSALVTAGTVRIVDAVLARRDDTGVLTVAELAGTPGWDGVAGLVDHLEGLLAVEDVDDLASGVGAGATALVLAFENSWVRPLLAAVRSAGGEVLGEVAVTDVVVQEIADTVPDEEEDR